MTRRMLFLSWDGPQVSYVESLFAPIFHGLKQHGIETDILQFSWGNLSKIETVATRCADLGIGYTSVLLSRRFGGMGAMMEAFAGARQVRAAVRRTKPDLIMPRSLMPALALLAARPSPSFPIFPPANPALAGLRWM